jgi:hypothetical protein
MKGAGVPPSRFPKKGQETRLPEVDSKTVKEEILQIGQATNIAGPAPAHRRLYMRDYSKTAPKPGDHDYVTDALGNPLKL